MKDTGIVSEMINCPDTKETFSKEDTLSIKGIAIILLVLYHCFATEERLYGYSVDFTPFSKELGFKVFESTNICVGMFVLLSAFGLVRKIQQQKTSEKEFVLTQIIKTHAFFVIPYILCTSVTIIVFANNPYGQGERAALWGLIDFLGLGGLLETPMMVGTWWYMSMAYVVILLAPPTLHFYKKYGISVIGIYLIPLIIDMWGGLQLTNMNRWLLAIPLGVLASDSRFFERFRGCFSKKYILVKVIIVFAYTIAIFALFKIRIIAFGNTKLFYVISSVLPAAFILYCYVILSFMRYLRKALSFVGVHSGNIFMTHTFIRTIWLKDFTYSIGKWYLIALFVLMVSLLLSLLIETFKKTTGYNLAVKKFSLFVVKWTNCGTNNDFGN